MTRPNDFIDFSFKKISFEQLNYQRPMILLSALVMVNLSIGQTRFPVAAIIVQNDQLNRFVDLSERNGQFVLTLVKPNDWVVFLWDYSDCAS